MKLFARFRSLIAELKRRRVLEVVAIYGGLSFALLEGVGIVTENLGVGLSVKTPLTLLVLFGLPVAIAVGWIYDIDSRGRLLRTLPVEHLELLAGTDSDEVVPREKPWLARVAVVAVGILLVSTSWYTARRIEAEAIPDPRGSYVVLPIQTRSQTAADLEAAEQAARSLTRQLRGWEDVRTIQDHVINGDLSRLGIKKSEAPTLEQAFEIAENRNVGTLLGLSVTVRGDSADLEVVMYDVAGQNEIEPSILETGSRTDLGALVLPVSQTILQLRNQDVSTDALRSESPNLLAHRDFEAGLDALHDWRLEEAEGEFRKAILEDSLFASAHHYVALALFWQTSRDAHRILVSGPEIARYAQAANRLAGLRSIRPGRKAHIAAFVAFWQGDYEKARQAYRVILEKDRSDTEAWLLLASVEYNDPLLHEVESGRLVPRRNLNIARAALESAADLSPDWQISYGQLSKIDRQLLSAATSMRCLAFDKPGSRARSPFEQVQAGDQVPFCPLVEDSVVWVHPADVDDERRKRAVEDAERLATRSWNKLQSWAQIYPEQARPHDELATWLAWRRGTLGCRADATLVQERTANILAEREISLALRADTTREDLVRLAMLHLAMDDVRRAISLIEQALRDLSAGEIVPEEAANAFLAMGMPGRALEISEPTLSTMSLAIRDPEGADDLLSMGDIAGPIAKLRIYGATGPAPEIERAFEALFAEWSTLGYSPKQAAHVRQAALGRGLWPALALVPDVWPRWFEGWDEAGVSKPVVWRGLLATEAGTEAGSAELNAALDEMLLRLERESVTGMNSHFFTGVLAQLAGRYSVAVEQMLLVESCPVSLEVLSTDWGLRTLGRWHRAQAYFALGDSLRGREALAGYSALRADIGPMPE